MPFMPFNFLFLWLVGLLSVGVLGGDIYIIYEWYIGALVGISYLISGVLMLLCSVGGRYIRLPLCRRPGADDPQPPREGTVQRVERPDDTILQVEFYAPDDGQ